MKKRLISVLLSVCLAAGVMLCCPVGANALYYSDGQKIARVITDEGIVMLKNENSALPIKRGSPVALFGEAQKLGESDFQDVWNMRGYIPYGYGSESQVGDFAGKEIDPLDALTEAERSGEIKLYHPTSERYAAALGGEEYIPTDEEVAAAAAGAETAVAFFSRWGGDTRCMR